MTADSAAPKLIAVEVDDVLADLLRRYPLMDGVADADMNQEEMAAALSTTVNTLSKWIKHEGMPVAQEGGLGKAYIMRLSHCWAWKCARDSDESQRRSHNAAQIGKMQAEFLGLDVDNPMAALSAKDRAALAAADISHSKAMHLRRQLVQLDDVVDLLEGILSTVRNKIEGMPDVLERELSLKPEEVDQVQRIGEDLLNDLAEQIEAAELRDRDVPEVEVQRQWTV